MTRRDLEAVLDIERRSFSNPWSAELFLQELRLPFSRVVLVWVGGPRGRSLVGYICRWITAGELHILNVAVHPEWRRRGIARRLVEVSLSEARRVGVGRAFLEVRRHNVAALTLYLELGFREAGVRRNYYGPGEDALVMERAV
jgi:ribosomal-protein-alanine N-acetyltransferase